MNSTLEDSDVLLNRSTIGVGVLAVQISLRCDMTSMTSNYMISQGLGNFDKDEVSRFCGVQVWAGFKIFKLMNVTHSTTRLKSHYCIAVSLCLCCLF